MHLDLDQPAALAIFAASALDVETESSDVVTAHSRRWQLREQLPNRTKRAGISHRVRARRPADRALIDHDRLVDLFHPAQRLKRARLFFRIIKTPEQRAPQNVVDQRRFAAPGNSGHAGKAAERQCDLDAL